MPTEREFQTSNPLLAWKWTRHFLACKYGSGEWIMEGEVRALVALSTVRQPRLRRQTDSCSLCT
jgi:hypothetical protein